MCIPFTVSLHIAAATVTSLYNSQRHKLHMSLEQPILACTVFHPLQKHRDTNSHLQKQQVEASAGPSSTEQP